MTKEQKELLESLCKTDTEVKAVVEIIRKDILPEFKDKVKVASERILVRKIYTKATEKETSGGLVMATGKETKAETVAFFNTHPFQGVVISIGGDLKTDTVKIGDHVICKNEVETGNFKQNTVLIDDYVFGILYITDIICSI